jgi:hypothetical protein
MTSDAGGAAPARRLELVAGRDVGLRAALADGDRARDADGDLHESRRHYERAWPLAEAAGDPAALAAAALGLAGLWVSEHRTAAGAAALEARLRHVLGLLDPAAPLALRVRARLAGEADYAAGRHDAILAALAQAREAGDPDAVAEALSLAHHCLLGPEHLRQRRDLAAELTRVSFRTGRRSDLLMGLLWQTADAYAAGDPRAGRLLGELRGQLSEQDHRAVGFVVSAIDVMLAIRAGRLAEAESLAGLCARTGAAAGDVDSDWWSAAQLVTIRWYQGRLPELLPVLRDRAQSPELSAVDHSALAALAVAAAQGGDTRTAASSLAALCGSDLARLPRSSSWLVTLNGVVEAAALLGDAAAAGQAYDLLRPHAALPLVGSLGVTCFGSAQQALGVAALTAGQPGRAVDHLRAAVRDNLALAHWPALAASRARLARAYERRGGPGDTAAAEAELDTAAAEAAALGLPELGSPAWRRSAAGSPAPGPAALVTSAPRPATTGPAATGAGTTGPAATGPGATGAGTTGRVTTRAGTTGPGATGAGTTEPAATGAGVIEAGAVAECSRAGRRWRVTVGGRAVLAEDSIGMAHLAVLIANPRQEIPAADLVAGLAALSRPAGDGAHPVLDHEAIAGYRTRLRHLDAELSDLDEAGDSAGRAAAARAERDWLVAQLGSAAGFAGRTRSFPDQGERARVAVGKAIRRALARIAAADPAIGEHLRQAVRTGVRCSYWPA